MQRAGEAAQNCRGRGAGELGQWGLIERGVTREKKRSNSGGSAGDRPRRYEFHGEGRN